MKNLFCLLFIFLAGCGGYNDHYRGDTPDDVTEYQAIYQSFLSEARQRGLNLDNLPVSIRDGGQSVPNLVRCFPNGAIEVNEYQIQYYITMNNAPSYREYVIFHGLGHCLLKRPESNQGIMLLNGWSRGYDLDRAYYLDDLFYGTETTSIPSSGIN